MAQGFLCRSTIQDGRTQTQAQVQSRSRGPLVWAPNLDPNTYPMYTIYQLGAIEQNPPESKRSIRRVHRKTLRAGERLGNSPLRALFRFGFGAWASKCRYHPLRSQVAQSRHFLHTLGPKVITVYILGSLGILYPNQQRHLVVVSFL